MKTAKAKSATRSFIDVPDDLIAAIDRAARDACMRREAWVRQVLEQSANPEHVADQSTGERDPRELTVAELRESLSSIEPHHDSTRVLIEIVTPGRLGGRGPQKERLVALSAKRGYCDCGDHPFVIHCERDS